MTIGEPGASVGEPGGDPVAYPNIANEYMLGYGQNLSNHSEALRGRAGFIRQGVSGLPVFRTRDAAYRYAAWLALMAEVLPPEGEQEFTFDEVLDAVRNA